MAYEIKKYQKKNGSISYNCSIRIKGHPPMYESFTRLTDARQWVSVNLGIIKSGKNLTGLQAKKHTVAELIERYIDEDLTKNFMKKELEAVSEQQILRIQQEFKKVKKKLYWWKKELGDYYLCYLDSELLESKCKKLYDTPLKVPRMGRTQRTGASVNRYRMAFSACLTKGVKPYNWLDENPFKDVMQYPESEGKKRILTQKEIKQLLEAAKKKNNKLYMYILISLCTGARYSSVRELRTYNINLEHKFIVFEKTKNGQDVYSSIPDVLYDELVKFMKVTNINSQYLFTGTKGNNLADIRGMFDDLIDKLEFNTEKYIRVHNCVHERITPHNIRHTASSFLAMEGVNDDARAEFVGQKTVKMQQRYTHYSNKFKQEMSEKLVRAYGL